MALVRKAPLEVTSAKQTMNAQWKESSGEADRRQDVCGYTKNTKDCEKSPQGRAQNSLHPEHESSSLRRVVYHPYAAKLDDCHITERLSVTCQQGSSIPDSRLQISHYMLTPPATSTYSYNIRQPLLPFGSFQKSKALSGSPCNRGHSILQSIWGPSMYGNSHLLGLWRMI